MKKITPTELKTYLTEILACDAFELHADAENIYIPYMMNDALECYLHFTAAQLTGRYLPDFEGETSFELIETDARCGIIFRQENENIFTLWFSDCYRILSCYRYDQIGHFWVKGQEHWRRLVYIIGTIYDKYEYMGEQVCNEKELALLPLMEFAPLRMYSPIHGPRSAADSDGDADAADDISGKPADPLGSIYADSKRGLNAMQALAEEADDRRFLFLLSLYRYLPFTWVKNYLHRAMNHPGRIKLYVLLFEKIREAACEYPQRVYDEVQNLQIKRAREQVSLQLQKQGFSGQYPLFQKENRQILAMEEHPFTILEANDFDFRIQLMESETAAADSRLNAGFFDEKGNRSRISPFSG